MSEGACSRCGYGIAEHAMGDAKGSPEIALGFDPATGLPTFDTLRRDLSGDCFRYEGVVWHHPDGRMAKLKRRDFPRSKEVV